MIANYSSRGSLTVFKLVVICYGFTMKLTIFGILNYTPDSFYDGGKNFAADQALAHAKKLIKNGADYIDVGAEATNPFVKPISAEDEIERLTPILPELLKAFPNKISLDTYHAKTLQWALQFGVPVLNDVSGLADSGMIKLASEHKLSCIVGHLPKAAGGVPTNSHSYKIDDLNQVVADMLERTEALEAAGIKKSKIILDPNIGFGKTMRLNWQLIQEFAKHVDYPVMIGASHKRFLGFSEAGNELEAGQELRFTKQRNVLAANYAQQSGAKYLRVHEPEFYKDLR
jgi:dihydropteroate synthase